MHSQSNERQSAQTIHSTDLFTRHPAGTTGLTMLIKSVLLVSHIELSPRRRGSAANITGDHQLRNVNRLVRLIDATAIPNAQKTPEFQALDQLITTFRYVSSDLAFSSGGLTN